MSELLNRDTLADSDEDIFKECAERLKISEDAEGENKRRAIEEKKFNNGEQWPQQVRQMRESPNENRPCLTINHTQTYVTRTQNTIKQQRPRIKCQPMGESATKEKAEVINGLMRHIENRSNSSVAYDQAGDDTTEVGWGYCRILSEYCESDSFDQELRIAPIDNLMTVYDDPSAMMPAGEDRGWLIIACKMKRTEYKRKYPNADNADYHTAHDDVQWLEWDSREEIRLAEYYRIKEVPDTLYLMNDGRTAYKSQMPSEETMAQSAWKPRIGEDGKEICRPTTRRIVEWFRLNGRSVIERREQKGKWIPVVKARANRKNIDGKISIKGMVRDLMDPARMYNYWRSSETERYALAPKAPWVMAEGQADGHPEWDTANQKPYSRLVYKPVQDAAGNALPPPQRQSPVSVEQGMAVAAQGAMGDLMQVAGMPMENPQDNGRLVSGAKYLRQRMAIQDMTHWQYYDAQKYMVMWVGIILLDLMPYYYDTDRMQRIVNPDGTTKMVRINAGQDDGMYDIAKNLKNGSYDVVMDTGPDYKTARAESGEAMLGLLETPMGGPIVEKGPDLVLRALDFQYADELADRMMPPDAMNEAIKQLPEQAQGIVLSLQRQNQQLQQLVQQQSLEIKYKAQIEAAKIEAGSQQAKQADDTKRLDIQTKAATARDVAEIHGATQLLNSQMESASEEKQADKMIQKGLDAEA